jgi:OmpA family
MRSVASSSISLLLAACSQAQPDQDVRIEGNCDQRGTTGDNLALGQRRADAAKKYLAAWQQNRRDDLIPVPGNVAASDAEAFVSR